MALNSIETEWNRFAAMVFASCNPSQVQIKEMKKAFFAGAWMMFSAMEEIGNPDVSEAEGIAYIEERKHECIAFKDEILREYSETN